MSDRFHAGGKTATLCAARRSDSPLIVLNHYSGDGGAVFEALRGIGCADCHLLTVGDLDWNRDMTPWACPPIGKNDAPFAGGADAYLKTLLDEILPEALAWIGGAPRFIGLAGYSLAGLFALYAMYRTDRFVRVASMSGSLWFPGFAEYAQSHEMARRPERLYLSVGDREAKTRNAMLRPVQANTEALARFYRDAGVAVTCELNPGNHFADAELRTAKGIADICR